MDHPIDFDQVPDPIRSFAAFESATTEFWGAETENAAFYQEIAERRAPGGDGKRHGSTYTRIK